MCKGSSVSLFTLAKLVIMEDAYDLSTWELENLDCKFMIIPGYIRSLRPTWATQDPVPLPHKNRLGLIFFYYL